MKGVRAATAAVVLVLVAVGLALTVLGSRTDQKRFVVSTETIKPVPTVRISASPPAGNEATSNVIQRHSEGILGVVGITLFLLVLALIVAFVLLLLPRINGQERRWLASWDEELPAGEVTDASVRTLSDAVEAGLRDMGAAGQGEVRDAVIACWVRLEGAAADAGTARRPAETAGELTERVLTAHQVTPETLRRLADLYREARYSAHTLGETQREQARDALEQVRRELGSRRRVSTVAGADPATGGTGEAGDRG